MTADYLRTLFSRYQSDSIESSYYSTFESLFNSRKNALNLPIEVVQHVNHGNKFPDFTIYKTEEGRRKTIAFIEAKKPGTPLQQMIAKATNDEEHQFSIYANMCPNLVVTDFREMHLITNGSFAADDIQSTELFNNFGNLIANPTQPQIDTLCSRFDDFLQSLALLQPSENTRAGALRLIATLTKATENAYIRLRKTRTENMLSRALYYQLAPPLEALFEVQTDSNETHEKQLSKVLGQCVGTALLLATREGGCDHPSLISADVLSIDYLKILFRSVYSNRGLLGLEREFDEAVTCLNSVEDMQLTSLENLEKAFVEVAKVVDPKWVKSHGFVPTPAPVIDYMVRKSEYSLNQINDNVSHGFSSLTNEDQPSLNILDPATGTGRYYLAIIQRVWGDLRERYSLDVSKSLIRQFIGTTDCRGTVLGFDIQPMCVLWSQITVMEWCADNGIDQDGLKPNIVLIDALNDPGQATLGHQGINTLTQRFFPDNREPDVIIGNPPWGAHEEPVQNKNNLKRILDDEIQQYKERTDELRGSGHGAPKKEVAIAFFTRFVQLIRTEGQILSFVIPDSLALKETWWAVRRRLSDLPLRIHVDFLEGGKQNDNGNNVFGTGTSQPVIIVTINRVSDDTNGIYRRIGFRGLSTAEKLDRLGERYPIPYDYDAGNDDLNDGEYQRVVLYAEDWLRWRQIEMPERFDELCNSPSLWEISQHSVWAPMAEVREGSALSSHRTALENRIQAYFESATWESAIDALPALSKIHKSEQDWQSAKPYNPHALLELNYSPMVSIHGYVDLWAKPRENYRARSPFGGYVCAPGQLDGNEQAEYGYVVAYVPNYPGSNDCAYKNGKAFAYQLLQICTVCNGDGQTIQQDLSTDDPVQVCGECGGDGLTDEPIANVRISILSGLDQAYGTEWSNTDLISKSTQIWDYVLAVLSSRCFFDYVAILEQDVCVPFPPDLSTFQAVSRLGTSLREIQSLQDVSEETFWGQLTSQLEHYLFMGDDRVLLFTDEEGVSLSAANFSVSGYTDSNKYQAKELFTTPTDVENELAFIQHLPESVRDDVRTLFSTNIHDLLIHRGDESSPRIRNIPESVLNFVLANRQSSVIQTWLCMHSEERAGQGTVVELDVLRRVISRIVVMLLMDPHLDTEVSAMLESDYLDFD